MKSFVFYPMSRYHEKRDNQLKPTGSTPKQTKKKNLQVLYTSHYFLSKSKFSFFITNFRQTSVPDETDAENQTTNLIIQEPMRIKINPIDSKQNDNKGNKTGKTGKYFTIPTTWLIQGESF